jgi:lipopolysaccharide/colanic/teichoic acid biosynthesis glycosyltransferase
MTLVGPRPEVEEYVATYRPDWQRLLAVRPGLTDPASLAFRDEQGLLAAVPPALRERAYREVVMPAKLALALDGVDRASILRDLAVLARTAAALLHLDGGAEHPAVAEVRRALRALERRSS